MTTTLISNMCPPAWWHLVEIYSLVHCVIWATESIGNVSYFYCEFRRSWRFLVLAKEELRLRFPPERSKHSPTNYISSLHLFASSSSFLSHLIAFSTILVSCFKNYHYCLQGGDFISPHLLQTMRVFKNQLIFYRRVATRFTFNAKQAKTRIRTSGQTKIPTILRPEFPFKAMGGTRKILHREEN